jgi:hypothetical protein
VSEYYLELCVEEKVDHFTFTQIFSRCIVGLSDGVTPYLISQNSNSYAISIPVLGHYLYGSFLDGEFHRFELPEGTVEQEMKENENVFGCGLVLEPDNKLAIFFTLNGQLLGKLMTFIYIYFQIITLKYTIINGAQKYKFLGRKIPISPTVDRLFPAVKIMANESIEANFGNNPAKPFMYDIKNCTGLELACI